MRVVIGSIADRPGWVKTGKHSLDITKPGDWRANFPNGQIDALLAEHVWEHLTAEEGMRAAILCYIHLRSGGYLRAAVPDGLHPDPEYIKWVEVGGKCPTSGADDHRVLYTYRTFARVFRIAGFDVDLLEYFDEEGNFHYKPWDPADGKVRRSCRFDRRNEGGKLAYTSIILDATKPDDNHFYYPQAI